MKSAAVFAIVFVAASLIAIQSIDQVQPLDNVATPNWLINTEIGLAVVAFVVLMAGAGRIRKSLKRTPFSRFLDRRIILPMPARVAALMVAFVCGSIFAFYATIDDLGGYNGPGSYLARNPLFRAIYNGLGPVRIHYPSIGPTALIFFVLTLSGAIALLANRGLGAAIKDSITLLAAPALVVFELGLLYFAPEDMTWHATSFLWIGGINDNGYRLQSTINGQPTFYPISNWLVLTVALLFLASRIPAIWSSREPPE